jgi:hypothetical protein
LRTVLHIHSKWGIKAETSIQQLQFARSTYKKFEAYGNQSSSYQSGNGQMLYFYQSLEANYQLNKRFSLAAGGFAGTLLSSHQDYPSMLEDERKIGLGLRDTRLGTQASISYQHVRGITAAFLRQDLKSIYTSEAQPAGAISPTSLSLSIGYRFTAAQ